MAMAHKEVCDDHQLLLEIKMKNALNSNSRAVKRFAIEETTLRELNSVEVDAVAGAAVNWTTISVTVTVTESSNLCTTITLTL